MVNQAAAAGQMGPALKALMDALKGVGGAGAASVMPMLTKTGQMMGGGVKDLSKLLLKNPALTGGIGLGAGGAGLAALLGSMGGQSQVADPNMGEIPPELLQLLGTRGKI